MFWRRLILLPLLFLAPMVALPQKSDKPEKGAIGPTPIRAVGIGRHPLEHQLPYGRPRTHPGDIAIEPVENAVVPGLGTQFGQGRAPHGQQVVFGLHLNGLPIFVKSTSQISGPFLG